MNPPFHEGGAESRALGLDFIEKAAAALRKGGVCWLVANRHLPYEATLTRNFREVRVVAGKWATRSSKPANEPEFRKPCGSTVCSPISAMDRGAKCKCWRATDA